MVWLFNFLFKYLYRILFIYSWYLRCKDRKINCPYIDSVNKLIQGRRIYDSDGCFFKILCFGGRAIISTSPIIMPWCEEKLLNSNGAWIFEYPKIRSIDRKLQEFGEAFAFDENHPDVLGVAAFDGDNIMGMAGASADSKLFIILLQILAPYNYLH